MLDSAARVASAAVSTAADTFFVFQTLDMPEPEERRRACLPLKDSA